MTYDQQIIDILLKVGQRGISVGALTKHVYNQNSTFFVQPDLAEIRQYVQQYLLRNSKSAQSLVESTGQRGCYRLNVSRSTDAQQLFLQFKDEREDEKEEKKPSQDLSLDLFSFAE